MGNAGQTDSLRTISAIVVYRQRLFRTDAGPEPVALADARTRFERLNDKWRQRDEHQVQVRTAVRDQVWREAVEQAPGKRGRPP